MIGTLRRGLATGPCRGLAAGTLLILAGAALLLAPSLRHRAAAAPAAAPPAPVRFHVIAHSDTPADQALKLQVRDALLPRLQALGAGAATAAELAAALPAALPDLEQAARAALAGAGAPYPVRVHFGPADFGQRRYGALHLPAGRYPTLRVVIGDGAGQNWWCVMFPPLCFPEWTSRVEPAETGGAAPAPADVAGALALAGSPLLLDEREVAELPVVARSALVRWLRERGWLP